MQAPAFHYTFDRIILASTVILLATLVTFLEITPSPLQAVTNILHSGTVKAPQALPTAKTTIPTPAPIVKTATTSTYVHLRAAKSTTSAIIANLNAGSIVQLRADSDATWQAVLYQGKPGYIFKSYIQY